MPCNSVGKGARQRLYSTTATGKIMKESIGRDSLRPHPVMLAAAVSVITFSLLGVGAVTGLIPSADFKRSDSTQEGKVSNEHAFNAPDAAGKPAYQTQCSNCGVIDAIRTIQIDGTVRGVGGEPRGNQADNGDAMTLMGSVGGVFAGHPVEKTADRRTVYRVTVRMDDGSFRTVSQSHPPSVAVGGKVRIVSGSLVEQS
jgi:outer membrane lipoprotein SlyB